MSKPPTLLAVINEKDWVQSQRLDLFQKRLKAFQFRTLSSRKFKWYWRLGLLKDKPIYFSTWRILHGLQNQGLRFQDHDYSNFMAAVTSHSNIGGGLAPERVVGDRTPEEAFQLATEVLSKCKIASVNSNILRELLNPALSNLTYCPNGVDTQFFSPEEKEKRPSDPIRIGWVGRMRDAKNYEVVQTIRDYFQRDPQIEFDIIAVHKGEKAQKRNAKQMREYYRRLDYYLCSSWNEGTPNPALEAAACGKPVITTRVGNMPDLVKHNETGFFIEPNVPSITQAIEHLKTLSLQQHRTLSRTVHHAVLSDWTWEKRLPAFEAAFSKLLSSESPTPSAS